MPVFTIINIGLIIYHKHNFNKLNIKNEQEMLEIHKNQLRRWRDNVNCAYHEERNLNSQTLKMNENDMENMLPNEG